MFLTCRLCASFLGVINILRVQYVLLLGEGGREVQQESIRSQGEHGDGCICSLSCRECFLYSWPSGGESSYHLFTLWGVLCYWEVRKSSFPSTSVWMWRFICFPEASLSLSTGRNSSSYKHSVKHPVWKKDSLTVIWPSFKLTQHQKAAFLTLRWQLTFCWTRRQHSSVIITCLSRQRLKTRRWRLYASGDKRASCPGKVKWIVMW